jgi:hypothetical protein
MIFEAKYHQETQARKSLSLVIVFRCRAIGRTDQNIVIVLIPGQRNFSTDTVFD